MDRSFYIAQACRVRPTLASCLIAASLALLSSAVRGEERWTSAHRFLLAQMAAQDGSDREALEILGDLVVKNPNEVYVRLEFAEVLYRLGQLPEAAEQAREARRLAPQSTEVLSLFGQIQLRHAEEHGAALDEAQEAFERLRELDPRQRQGMVSLGQIYLSRGLPARAAAVFAELLGHRPGDRTVVSFLTDAYTRAGQDEEAERVLRRVLDRDPAFLSAWLRLAGIQSGRGDHAAAVDTLARARSAGQRDPQVTRMYAVELYRADQSLQALLVTEELLAEQPDDFGVRYLRALVLVDLGRNAEALRLVENLSAEQPDNPEVTKLLVRLRGARR